ncbi:uncharacterized protein [Euphorbia lathyris]|uniref:uncharacterized protein isoform X2 n=2 Tax=Euphorbia lathyris TaxID=212925 RepID=UPI00331420D3
MDEFSNGKTEETEKVEVEVKDEKLVIEDAEEPKPEAESVIQSMKESHDAEDKEEAKEESCILHDLEEKEVINSIFDSDEVIVETLMDSDVIEVESEGIGETEIESKGIDETELEQEGIDVGLLNGARETMWPESISNKPNGGASEVGLGETEEEIPPSLVDVSAADDEETQVESQGIGETEIESKGINETELEQEGIDVGLLNGARETMWPESTSNKPNGGASEVGLGETEEEISPSLVDVSAADDEETQVESQGIGETEIESKGINETELKPQGIDVGLTNGARETMLPESTSNKPNGGASEVGLSETEDEISPSLVDASAADDDETQVESQGIGETEMESKGINETELEPQGIDVGLLNGERETMWPESTSNKPTGASEVGFSETEDKISPSLVDKDENPGLPDVVTRGIEEIKVEGNSSVTVDKESVQTSIDGSLKPSADAIIVGSNDAFPETIGNPHIISISQRTIQPTTWRSCCGLFQVLKRSNRCQNEIEQ